MSLKHAPQRAAGSGNQKWLRPPAAGEYMGGTFQAHGARPMYPHPPLGGPETVKHLENACG